MTFREMTPERLARVRAMRGLLLSTERDDLFAHIDALTARLEAAERERDERDLSGEVLARADLVLNGPNPETHWRSLHDIDVQVAALKARAEAAEKKLAALVEAIDARDAARPWSVGAGMKETRLAYEAALRAARGEP